MDSLIKKTILVLFFFLPLFSHAAISLDATSVSGCTTCASVTYNHTEVGSPNLACVGNTARALTSTITYGVTSLTSQVSDITSSWSSIWCAPIALTGVQSVVVTEGSIGDHIGVTTWTFLAAGTVYKGASGVDSTDNGSAPSISLTTQNANSIIIDQVGLNGEGRTITKGASQTLVENDTYGSGAKNQNSSYRVSTTVGSYTMTWSVGNGAVDYGYSAMEVMGDPAGASSPKDTMIFSDF